MPGFAKHIRVNLHNNNLLSVSLLFPSTHSVLRQDQISFTAMQNRQRTSRQIQPPCLAPRPLSRLRNERQRREAVFAGYLRRSVYLFYDDSDFQTYRLLISMAFLLFISISLVNENIAVVVADSA